MWNVLSARTIESPGYQTACGSSNRESGLMFFHLGDDESLHIFIVDAEVVNHANYS